MILGHEVIFPSKFSDFDRSTFIVFPKTFFYFQYDFYFTYEIVDIFFINFYFFIIFSIIKFSLNFVLGHEEFFHLNFFLVFRIFLVCWTLYLLQTRVFNNPIFPGFYFFELLKLFFYIIIMEILHDIVANFSLKIIINLLFFYNKLFFLILGREIFLVDEVVFPPNFYNFIYYFL